MHNLVSMCGHVFIKDLFEMMSEVLAGRDYSTYEHTTRVAAISRQIGSVLRLPEEELNTLELGGLVHDIGKTAIPDDILLKPDIFNNQDRRIMEFHPLIGARLFARRVTDNKIVNIIFHHHERLDGSGYTQGLQNEEIDILTRITAVADVFEALTAKRPYKKPVAVNDAFDILKQEADINRLDGYAVEALTSLGNDIALQQHSIAFPNSDFMQEIERFRRDSFFRDPVSELYNYRQLLILDDEKLLGKAENSDYQLHLITFKDFSRFQLKYGFIIANQVHEEIGQRLQETVSLYRQKRHHYDGSIMLFKKHCDYLIYAEADNESDLADFLGEVKKEIEMLRREWGLESKCYRQWFSCRVSIEEAMTRVFHMQADADKRCSG